jgi:hypothetical protein
VLPAAERGLQNESPDQLVDVLCRTVRVQVEQRHEHAMTLKAHAPHGVVAARAYVEAMLGLQVWPTACTSRPSVTRMAIRPASGTADAPRPHATSLPPSGRSVLPRTPVPNAIVRRGE